MTRPLAVGKFFVAVVAYCMEECTVYSAKGKAVAIALIAQLLVTAAALKLVDGARANSEIGVAQFHVAAFECVLALWLMSGRLERAALCITTILFTAFSIAI